MTVIYLIGGAGVVGVVTYVALGQYLMWLQQRKTRSGRRLSRREKAAWRRALQAYERQAGEHPGSCGCRSCLEKGLRSGGIP